MNLSGQLADWSMDDLLQIVHVTRKTGSLDIVGIRKGRVHFREGRVTAAELHSSRGVYAGTDPSIIADVVFVLGSMDEGAFTMGRADGPDVDGIEIDEVTKLVGELRSLETVVSDQGLIGTGEVRLTAHIDEEITISPDDWAVLAALVQPFTFEGLEERLGRGAAIRVVHAFHRLGVAEAGEAGKASTTVDHGIGEVSEEESSWLDRLADEVSSTDSTRWLDDAASAGTPDETGPPAPSTDDAEVEVETDKIVERVAGAKGIAAPASTTLTHGVYDDIRRLRSKVSD